MAQQKKTQTQTKTNGSSTSTGTSASARKPSEQALQVVDVAVGVVPETADAVTKTVDQLRDKEALFEGAALRSEPRQQPA